jgi:serine/threonine protein kinase/tetratricopeptide (TPR) repeat protein
LTIPAGTRFGPYEILSPLGAGGMGEVYRARDTRLGRDVALKVLPEEFARDPERVRRFEVEARSASMLSDSHIVTVFDVGEQGGVHYLATELVEGSDLRKRLDLGPMPVPAVIEIGVQIAEGLSTAHERGIVHRDLKPENILMTRSGIAKIADFGLAKQTASSLDGSSQLATAATDSTGTGVVMGTVAYMSPEQARGAKIDFRSDQFSFGLILYEMLAGTRAFARNNAADTLSAILRDEPEPLRRLARDVPEPFAKIVHRCLSKEAANRYGSTRDLLHDIRALSDPAGTPRRSPWPLIAVALAAVAVAVAAAVFISLRRARPASTNIDSLAILPFANSGGKPEMEFLSDGITESLINKVSQVSGLKVISRESSFHYKGREIDPGQVAKDLSVKALLTGHVLALGDSLSVGVELIAAGDGRHLWGDQYNRKMSDIFSMQSDIASEIANALRGKLTGEEKGRLQKRPTQNLEAYQAYLKGKYFLNRNGPLNLESARTAFDEAISRDPNFALAYAGLSAVYGMEASNSYREPGESWSKSRKAAQRAVELDESSTDAHSALAAVYLLRDWDWLRAEKELKRAMELGPPDNSWAAPDDLNSFLLEALGRTDEAIAAMKKAQRPDPLAVGLAADLANAYYLAREYDLALAEARRGLELQPDSVLCTVTVAQALAMQGKFDASIAAWKSAVILAEGTSQPLGFLGWVYGRAGRSADAREIARRLESLSKQRYVAPFDLAMAQIGLGNRDEAFVFLNRAVEDRNTLLIFLNVEPMFDPIRSDPRFAKLVARVGLPLRSPS